MAEKSHKNFFSKISKIWTVCCPRADRTVRPRLFLALFDKFIVDELSVVYAKKRGKYDFKKYDFLKSYFPRFLGVVWKYGCGLNRFDLR